MASSFKYLRSIFFELWENNQNRLIENRYFYLYTRFRRNGL